MKIVFSLLFFLGGLLTPAHAQEDAWSYTTDAVHPGKELQLSPQEREQDLNPSEDTDNDPFEPVNRVVFEFNELVDTIFLEPLAAMYEGVVHEFIRERVGYALRNLSEPLVLVNNLLQGELGDAGETLDRFLLNSTYGVGGLFDVSTDLGIPYKKEDFGMTLASWGMGAGPYIVLPILGPSNLRDTLGRIGDYGFDPINVWGYSADKELYCDIRTGVQILDAKTDNIKIIEDLRKNAIDYYATIRTWYSERRKHLVRKESEAIETPRPDEDE